MNVLVRLVRALPLLIFFAILAVVVYAAVASFRSPERAKEVLIKLFTVISVAFSVFFGLASAYALFENNTYVLELTCAFAFISLLTYGITFFCRLRFMKNHPDYKFKKGTEEVKEALRKFLGTTGGRGRG